MSLLFTSDSKSPGKLRSLIVTLGLSALLFVILDQLSLPIMVRAFGRPVNLLGDKANAPGVESLWQMEDADLRPIVFTGSSEMQMALSPLLFDQQMQTGPGISTQSVNVSFVGATPIMTLDALRALIMRAKPPVVIYGIEMRALNQSQQPSTGEMESSPLGYALGLGPGLQQEAIFWLAKHSGFFRYRGNLRDWFLDLDDGSLSLPIDDRGFSFAKGEDNSPSAIQNFRDQFLPFQPSEAINTAFDEIGRLCHQYAIQCIVLNMPLNRQAYNYITPTDEIAYMKVLRGLTTNNKLPLWNFNTADCWSYLGDNAFYDLNHLNQDGAQRFTSAVALLYTREILRKPLPSDNAYICAQVFSQ